MRTASDPVALAQALIRCESVTPVEGGALTLLEGVLSAAGFECHRMTFSEPGFADVQNLYARRGHTGPNLCFAGHTDVVPPGNVEAWTSPPFAAQIRDGILYGRGAVDMKGEIACFVAATQRFLATDGADTPGSISLLITGDEEGDSVNGTIKVLDWLKARGEVLHACIVGEPSSRHTVGDEIKIGRRGSLNGDLIVEGKQGHAAYPHIADNPVPKLARIVDRLSGSQARRWHGALRSLAPRRHRHFRPQHGNQRHPRPGARALQRALQRCAPARRSWRSCCATPAPKAAAEVDARFTLAFSGTGDVFVTEPGPLVDTMKVAVQEITGRIPELSTTGGTSDARFIKDHCPVVELGLLNATIHQVDERVPVADLETLTKIYERFIALFFARA